MRKKTAVAVVITLFVPAFLFGAEEPKVELRKLEERTEAVVRAPQKPKPQAPAKKGFVGAISNIDDEIAGFAALTCGLVGKGTEVVVTAVQKPAGFILSPLFKALDVVNWGK